LHQTELREWGDKGGKLDALDNLCGSIDSVAAWNGQQLHHWRVHSHIVGAGACGAAH
jgi:hypothetical protein